jgi:hypothetical protein
MPVTPLRRRLSWIACGWLCCQLAALTLAPVSLVAASSHAADSLTCTCVHGHDGPDAYCPMHHPAKSKSGCECRSTTDPDAPTIVSLIGPIAVLADASLSVTPPPITKLPTYPITQFVGFVAAPDGPPPRA